MDCCSSLSGNVAFKLAVIDGNVVQVAILVELRALYPTSLERTVIYRRSKIVKASLN